MNVVKFLIIQIALIFCCNTFAQNSLLVKAHHPNDKKTIIRIWVTPENNYIIRTTYSEKQDDFEQQRLMQWQKKIEYDGFAKNVIFTPSDKTFYIVSYSNSVYSLVFGFFSEALNDAISVSYKIDFINEKVFNNL